MLRVWKTLLSSGAGVPKRPSALLTLHIAPIGQIAKTALRGGSMAAVAALRQQMAIDAALALLVLMIVTALAVIKPRGTTPFYR